ncbi:MAG TPA: IMP dehydrogenase, partial [bacterium]|nr:IMP dehydrogenase [bacterium]
MTEFLGRRRVARRTYGLDELALVPASTTVDPLDVDLSWSVDGRRFALPFVGAAMDSVVDVDVAVALGRLGALGVINLEGLQTRYERPEESLERIGAAPVEEVVPVMQRLYAEPVKDDLVAARIQAIVDGGGTAAVSVTPAMASRLVPVAERAGAHLIILQSTVVTDRHHSSRGRSVPVRELIARTEIPVMVGNTVGYDAAMALLEAGAA